MSRTARMAGTIALACCQWWTLSAQTADYQREVHPVLAAKCLGCHSQEKRSGGLSLGTYEDVLEGGRSGAAVRPGNGAGSLLIQRITGETQPRMPVGMPPLSESEVAVIRGWIDAGARATPASAAAKPKWEPPLELTRPAPPEVVWKNWTAPIDRFVAAYLKAGGIPEPEQVSDAQFARRAYLDIQGLLPDPDALGTFLNDPSGDKRQKLVAALLADNDKYAEHWISFWNDLLRNDEGVTYHAETAARKSITPWLLEALKTNLPYDRFVSKLLNPVDARDPDGFLVGVNWRGTVSASQTPAMQAAQNTAQIFLGINLKCNACHDSFINRWKLKEAYSMASYFSAEPKLQLFRCDVAQSDYAGPGFLYPQLNRVPPSDSLADRRATAAAIFTDPRNGRLPRTLVNRVWQRLLGHGLVEDPDDLDGEPWDPGLLDWLAGDFAASGYDVKRLIGNIVSSRAYQMPAVPRGGDRDKYYSFRGPEVRRLTAEQFADAIGAITGDWHVYQPSGVKAGRYTREWRVASSPLTRALGRPIRDQVYSTRDTQATTLQALELVNGEALTHWLLRGAKKMLGQLPPEPVSIFDRPIRGRDKAAQFEVDISGADKLWLLVQDSGSYSPEKVEAVWSGVELVSDSGVTPLTSLKPLNPAGLRAEASDRVPVKTPSMLAYEIGGKGFRTLRGVAGIENKLVTSDINPQIRFFIFREEPNPDRLTPVEPVTPLPAGPVLKPGREVVDRIFRYALGREPSASERSAAEAAAQDAAGVADLLWAVMMKPEFQLIY